MTQPAAEISTCTMDRYTTETALEIGRLMAQLDPTFGDRPMERGFFNRHFKGNPERGILLAQAAGRVVGTAVMNTIYEQSPAATCGYMGGFVVDQQYRGSGAAVALWGEMHAWCRPRGLYTFAFNTESTRPAAIRFYEKMGAQLVPGTVGHYTVEVLGEKQWDQFLQTL